VPISYEIMLVIVIPIRIKVSGSIILKIALIGIFPRTVIWIIAIIEKIMGVYGS